MGKRKKYKLKQRQRDYPDAAYADNGMPYARARLQNPHQKHLYYAHHHRFDQSPWVEQGYTTWTIEEWDGRFGSTYGKDGRRWEFFGDPIDIWEGYSEE